jgi:hypothetical protein
MICAFWCWAPPEYPTVLVNATDVLKVLPWCESFIFGKVDDPEFLGLRLRISSNLQVTLRKTADGVVEATVVQVEGGTLEDILRDRLQESTSIDHRDICETVPVSRRRIQSTERPALEKLYRRFQKLAVPLAVEDEQVILHADTFQLWVRSGLLDLKVQWSGEPSHPLTEWSKKLLRAITVKK